MKENDSLIDDEAEEEEINNNLNQIDNISQNQNPPDNSNTMIFSQIPIKEEIIKVDNCSYIKETKKISTFYFCSCSKEEFHPICEACAQNCHKMHKPSQTIKGIYVCKCGECNHQITEESEQLFQDRQKKQSKLCFYSKLLEVTPGLGFFRYQNKTYCGVCIHNCVGLEKDEKDRINQLKIDDSEGNVECLCDKHFEQNIINLNLDFASKPKFNLCFENINFNILSKIPFTKEKYITYLVVQLQDYKTKVDQGNDENNESVNFFTNFITGKIFSLVIDKLPFLLAIIMSLLYNYFH